MAVILATLLLQLFLLKAHLVHSYPIRKTIKTRVEHLPSARYKVESLYSAFVSICPVQYTVHRIHDDVLRLL